jgi:hypothetical protein
MSTAISSRLPAVTLEYDTAKGRTTKHFEDANAAKRRYTALAKAGKNPRVVGDDATTTAPAPTDTAAVPETAPETGPAAPTPDTATSKPDWPRRVKPAKVNPNVRSMTRICGEVIARHGLAAGVTQAMVDEVAEIAGRDCPGQDFSNLRTAWHVISGYLAAVK